MNKHRKAIGYVAAAGLFWVSLASPTLAQPMKTGSICARWRDVAEQIMHARQTNVSMPAAQRRMRGKPQPATVSSLITKAYDKPVFVVAAKKKRAVTDFGASVYSVCRDQVEGD